MLTARSSPQPMSSLSAARPCCPTADAASSGTDTGRTGNWAVLSAYSGDLPVSVPVSAGSEPAAGKEWMAMPKYVLTYRNPTGYIPSAETRAAWIAWFDGMGDHLVEQGKPAVARTSLGNCSPANTELGGY